VQFYDRDEHLHEVVTRYVAEGLEAGDPIVVIATDVNRRALVSRLVKLGFDVAAYSERDQLIFVEAHEALASFMVNGLPDRERFRSAVLPALERSRVAAGRDRVRAYGEMVNVLWREGHGEAAIALEELWNELAETESLSLLCAYGMSGFEGLNEAAGFDRVCALHSHVVPTEAFTTLSDPDEQLRQVTLLQQRARALERELRRRTDVQRTLAEAVRVRDDFLALAGHELRTPLTVLKLQVERLLRTDVPSPAVRESATMIARQTDRLALVVEQVLDTSSVCSGRFTLERDQCDLTTVLRDELRRMAPLLAAADCSVEVDAPESVTGAWDRSRIEQVVQHLLANAMKFGRGAPIRIEIAVDDDAARMVVRDQGIGISMADRARIFQRFERAVSVRNFGGLGLGLWFVRQIVDAHGGNVSVESTLGHGAAFTVVLPTKIGAAGREQPLGTQPGGEP
jgi:signal transduction histidine kinase